MQLMPGTAQVVAARQRYPKDLLPKAVRGRRPLTPASLAPAQAVEVHPYVPKLDTREMHTQRVWSSR